MTSQTKVSDHASRQAQRRGILREKSIGRALVLLAALVTPASAENIKFRYVLQCSAVKSVPPDNDPDPIFQIRIVATENGAIYIRHFAASGEHYTRNEQYRDIRSWTEDSQSMGKTDNWSGTSVRHPDRTMVGQIRPNKTSQWIEYVEKAYRGGKITSTTTSVCRFVNTDTKGERS
jgi:hypothetical protein